VVAVDKVDTGGEALEDGTVDFRVVDHGEWSSGKQLPRANKLRKNSGKCVANGPVAMCFVLLRTKKAVLNWNCERGTRISYWNAC
jgi:hypothetical protein